MALLLPAILSLLAHVALAGPGQMSKVIDFCNGACPSTPGKSGIPTYGQSLFPSMTVDASGNLYIVSAKFGGAYFDDAELTSYSPAGKKRWSFSKGLPGAQAAYWLQIVGDNIYIQSSSCCSPQGSYKGHIVKLSLDGHTGTQVWSRDVEGSPVIGNDGTIYGLATPSTAKGPVSYVYAMADNGNILWNYTDGVSSFRYIQIQSEGKQGQICMPATVDSVGSIVCLNRQGKLVHKEQVIDTLYMQFELIGNGGEFYVRRSRDNSYWHNGTNVLYPVGAKKAWTFTFPDDVDMIGPIARSADGALVVMTRPDCQCRADSLIAVGPDGKMRWNATLPGDADVSVNPGYPPNFGPYNAGDGTVFASSVQKLHNDNTTFDMWYSAINKEGASAWKVPMANITDLTSITYSMNAAGDFYMIKDGVLSKVAAELGTAKAMYV